MNALFAICLLGKSACLKHIHIPTHHSQYHHHVTKKMTIMSWLPYASSCQIKEKQLIKGVPILMRLM